MLGWNTEKEEIRRKALQPAFRNQLCLDVSTVDLQSRFIGLLT
jgi:hypothetical protein